MIWGKPKEKHVHHQRNGIGGTLIIVGIAKTEIIVINANE